MIDKLPPFLTGGLATAGLSILQDCYCNPDKSHALISLVSKEIFTSIPNKMLATLCHQPALIGSCSTIATVIAISQWRLNYSHHNQESFSRTDILIRCIQYTPPFALSVIINTALLTSRQLIASTDYESNQEMLSEKEILHSFTVLTAMFSVAVITNLIKENMYKVEEFKGRADKAGKYFDYLSMSYMDKI